MGNITKKRGKTEVYPFWELKHIEGMMNSFIKKEQWDFYLAFMIGLLLGRRVSDTLSVKWSDFYYENGRMKDEITTIEERKTGKTAVISVCPFMQEILKFYEEKTKKSYKTDISDFIFYSEGKEQWRNHKSALIYIHEDDIDERAKIERWVEFLGKKFSQKHINDIYNRWLACKKVKSRKRRSFDTLEEFLYDEELKIALKVPTSAYQKAFKQTAREVGITYNVNTHSTRKTFGYWSRQIHPHDLDSLEILRQIYVHATQAMTADYIGITAEKKKKYFHDFGEMMKRVANGEEYVIDNTPVISIKTSDLRDILTLAITDKSVAAPLDMMNKLMGMVEECRVV